MTFEVSKILMWCVFLSRWFLLDTISGDGNRCTQFGMWCVFVLKPGRHSCLFQVKRKRVFWEAAWWREEGLFLVKALFCWFDLFDDGTSRWYSHLLDLDEAWLSEDLIPSRDQCENSIPQCCGKLAWKFSPIFFKKFGIKNRLFFKKNLETGEKWAAGKLLWWYIWIKKELQRERVNIRKVEIPNRE